MLIRTSTSKVGENAHKITKSITLTKRGLKVFANVISCKKKLRFMVEEAARKGKGVVTNKNRLGVEIG
jgi:hypothetical protein